MISYAQNFEDVILSRVFNGQEDGFYVDIGVWDATQDSVTKHFYDAGWSGVNVEPLKSNFDRIQAARPRDINLNFAVSSSVGPVSFFDVRDTGLSTSRSDYASTHANQGLDVTETIAETISLEKLLASHVRDRTVDFLKIDVEGAEADVIHSNNWRVHRPRLLIIEATLPRSPIESYSDWEPDLLNNGFEFCYFDGLNRWYIREEDQHLRERLKNPPNVFDDFVLSKTLELEKELEKTKNRLQSALIKANRLDTISQNLLGKVMLRIL